MSEIVQTTTENTSIELIEFYLGDLVLGIQIDDINRIVQRETLTAIPNSPKTLEGVFELEDEVIPVISLFSLFDVEPSKDEKEDKYIIISHCNEPVAFHCGNVIRIYNNEYQLPQPNDTKSLNAHVDLIYGVVKNESQITLLINTDKLLALI